MIAKSVAALAARIRHPSGQRFVLAFSAAAIARLALLMLAILLARRFGAQEYGIFTFGVGAATLTSNCAALGWPNLFNRLYPGLARDQDWAHLKGLRNAADLIVLATGAIASIVLVVLAVWSTDLRRGFICGALLTIPFTIVLLRKQQLAGVRQPALGLLFDQGFAALVTFVVALLFNVRRLDVAIAIFFGASLLGALLATVVSHRKMPQEVRAAEAKYKFATWLKLSLPMSAGTVSKNLLNKMDVLMLAPLASTYDVGLYGAAWRLTYLLTFPQVVLMTVLTPLLSEAFTHHDNAKIRNIMRLAAIYAWATTLPTIIVFMVAPSEVMSLVFGAKFAVAGTTLLLLGLAQFVAAFTNANAALLMMAGKERVFGVINMSVVVTNIALNAILMPLYGRDGGAVSALVTSCLLLGLQFHHSRQLQRSLRRLQPSAGIS